jgi:hypothetical protein
MFIRGLAVVLAAICWILGAAHSAPASTLILLANPALTADPSSAYPGDQIKISGSHFSQCEGHNISPNVMVSWDGSDWATGTAFHGGFSVTVAVPSDAAAGSHHVTAGCYDPQASPGASQVLASAEVQVWPGPGLQLSSDEAAAGDSVTVAGTGFGQCPGKVLGDYVQLLFDAVPLGEPVGLDGNGAFSADETIPAAATAGRGHVVAAECYDPATGSATSGVLAQQPFSVTPPTPPASTTPASPPTSTPPTTPATSTSPTVTPTTSTSSPAVAPGQPSTPSDGRWSPVALTAGLGGGLAVVVLLLAGLLAMHARGQPRSRAWVHKHLRTVARPLDAAPASMRILGRPGTAPLSIGLDPHPDRPGNQQVKEITP